MELIKATTKDVQIKSNESKFAECRVGDLMEISDKKTKLITMISQLTSSDIDTEIGEDEFLENIGIPSVKVIDCDIIGSVIKGKFTNAVDHHIYISKATARKITSKEFSSMLQPDISECFKIGAYAGYDTPAYVNGNKFYQRHACIVGNTGSGKSETVTKFVEETAKNPGANMIIFDIHGEYGGLSYADNIRVGENFPFSIWLLGFGDMVTNILKLKEESATVAMSALRKAYYHCCSGGGNEYKPLRYRFSDILTLLKRMNEEMVGTGEVYKTGDKKGEEKVVKGDYNGKLSGIINTMETFYSDSRYEFLFEDKPQTYLFEVINRIMGGDKPIKNIDLSEVPHDIAILIIGAITKLIYNVQITKKDATPITLVCDEAHVYIPADFQLSASQRRMVEIFENISKEGRKFGITLFVASQRPSELNKTIMAQCANYIVMKLNNENDKSMMKGVMAEGSSGIIETTTMFSPGDCLIIGDAVPIPLKIKVELAKERPQAKTIQFWDEWKKERAVADYAECLDEYLRN